jgi:predicted tellurium resistance membrane protein TerC
MNTAGTKNNVAVVANISPPITARPKGAFCSPPSPRPKAIGTIPMIMANAVINTVILATITMIAFAAAISAFVNRYPTFKMSALSFLVLIGVVLIAEGPHQYIPKGYIYFAMGFAVLIELVNMRICKRVK